MSRRLAQEDSWEDDSAWGGDDQEEATIACPYCQRQIHEDSPRCPHCEQYLSEEDAPPAHKPWWIIVGALLCLYAVYHWIVG